MKKTKNIIVAVAAVLIGMTVSTVSAQTSADNVIEVKTEGNKNVTQAAIFDLIKIRPGQPYNEKVVKDDVQRLLTSGKFDSVQANRTQAANGVIVTFMVVERSGVSKIVFTGNKAYRTDVLAKLLGFGVGDPLSKAAVEAGRTAIEDKYKSGGFHNASVSYDKPAMENRGDVIYRITEGGRMQISKIVFEGNKFHTGLFLQFKISSKAKFWPIIQGYLDTELLDQDVSTIRNLYISEGYLDADVGRRLEPSADKKTVIVKFAIKEGPRYKVNSVSFDGMKVFQPQALAGRIKLKKGEYLTAEYVKMDTERLEKTYGEIGFINAKVQMEKKYKEQPGLIDVIFHIQEEDQYYIGTIKVAGNTITQDRVIRRELRFFPEKLYNTVAVEESKRRLEEYRLFEDVSITSVPSAVPNRNGKNYRDITINVKEGKTSEFLVSVGADSNDGIMGRVSYTQRNFDIFNWGKPIQNGGLRGAGQTFSIVAEPGLKTMRFSMDWFTPYIFDLPYTMGTKAFAYTRDQYLYQETRYGGVVSFGKRFPNHWYAEVATTLQGVDISDVYKGSCQEILDGEGMHFMPSLKATAVRNTTDSRWQPSTGDSLTLSYEQFFGSDVFGRAQGDYHIYRTLYKDVLDRKHIIAGRVAVGNIFTDAPFFERYYGGGIGSVRGFRYRGISPRGTDTNDPIGGNFMFFAGTEYTFPLITDVIRGAVFLDTGTVESDAGFQNYRASIGAGIRWTIPFFGPIPMSLDLAIPIAKQSEDRTQLVSFSLGWTF